MKSSPSQAPRLCWRCHRKEVGHPLLVVGEAGKGRTGAWTTDIGPHWLPNEFLRWHGFKPLWSNLIHWVSRRD